MDTLTKEEREQWGLPQSGIIGPQGMCAVCGNDVSRGHFPDCDLAALLDRFDVQPHDTIDVYVRGKPAGVRMTRRIPAGTDFVLVGSRWARDGYSGDGG